MRNYVMILPRQLADELDRLAKVLNCSHGEVIGRAIILLNHAIQADSVILHTFAKTQTVIVR